MWDDICPQDRLVGVEEDCGQGGEAAVAQPTHRATINRCKPQNCVKGHTKVSPKRIFEMWVSRWMRSPSRIAFAGSDTAVADSLQADTIPVASRRHFGRFGPTSSAR
jgi:hypothetical protein